MKASRPNRRLPPLHMTADEFERLAAVADRAGCNMALFAKRAVMRAVARQEAFASLSGHREAAEGPASALRPAAAPLRPMLRLNGHAAPDAP